VYVAVVRILAGLVLMSTSIKYTNPEASFELPLICKLLFQCLRVAPFNFFAPHFHKPDQRIVPDQLN